MAEDTKDQQHPGTQNLVGKGMNRDLMEKECKWCKRLLPVSAYGIGNNISGIDCTCKDCRYKKHNEMRAYYKIHPKKEIPIVKEGYRICVACKIEKSLDEYHNNKRKLQGKIACCKFCVSKRMKGYIQKSEKHRMYQKTERGRIKINESHKRSREKNPHYYRIRSLLGTFLKRVNRKKSESSATLLGYTPLQFKERFPILDDKHIDHKIPVSWFSKEVPVYIQNALDNLQLLTKQENSIKCHKYCDPVNYSFYEFAIEWILPEYRNKILISNGE
jgi:hypothetical protein